jgi:hypothetical protein
VTFIKENFINFVVNIYSMDGEYTNLDEKMKQPPNRAMYEIYTSILKAMKEGGIKIEEGDNSIVINIGNPNEESYLTILQKAAENHTKIRYKVSGELAKELAMGIGKHFPTFEGLDKLVDNISYVGVETCIRDNEKRCESGREYCRKITTTIEIIRKSYRNPKQDETQPQQPTELGVKLAQSALRELTNLVANYNISASAFDDGSTYVSRKDNEEPIFIVWPPYERGLQSFTVSGKLAEDLIREIGRYIPLPRDLEEAKNVRVIWEYYPNGYAITLKTETEPRKPTNFSK